MTRRSLAGLVTVLMVAAMATSCAGRSERLIVVAGTTVVDSGFMGALEQRFEAARPDIEVSIVGAASGEAFELAAQGAADVIIVHAPKLESEFLQRTPAAKVETVFASSFVLVGPPDHRLDGMTPGEAFAEIARNQWPFASRADGSGTHEREVLIWDSVGVQPSDPWLFETGQGMGFTLLVAADRDAFALAELGTVLAELPGTLRVADLVDDELLDNPYRAIVPGGSAAAVSFVDWLVSPEGVEAITTANNELFERAVYVPAR